MLAVRPARRHPFGRLRRLCAERARRPHRRCAAEAHRVGLLRHRARPDRRVQAAARPRDRDGQAQAGALHRPTASDGSRRRWSPGRDLDWDDVLAGARRTTACRSPPPIRSTSSTRRARPGSPKGVVRDNGGHLVALNWTMKNVYGIEPGRSVLGGLRHRLGGRPLLHRLCAADPRLHDGAVSRASRSARRTPARSGASSRSTRWRACSRRRPRFARSSARIPKGELISKHDLVALPHAVSRRRTPAIRTRCSGREDRLEVPVIDHWWQTETGWPICANCVGLGMLPVKPGSPTKPVPGWDVRVLDGDGQPVRAGRDRATWSASCRCRRDAADALERRRRAIRRPISRSSPATTRPATPASSTKTAMCS